MPEFSLFRPMQGLPWYLVPIWPLIYLRIQRLRAWFKANGGPGSQMLWAVTKHGRVDVVYLSDDMSTTLKHPWNPLPLSHSFSTALSGEPQTSTHPCPRRKPGPLSIASSPPARDPGFRREYGYVGPIPDT